MTFEEFFGKKKINLFTLAEHEPALFAEFRSHYDLMGPKSFDHTKKYWFNELRRRFPAPKVEKIIPVIVKTETVINVEAATTPSPQTIKQGFKPMFKRGAAISPAAEKQAEKILPTDAGDLEELPAKPAYTPKFKPGLVTASKIEEIQQVPTQKSDPNIPVETPDPKIKPAYKPRFNSAVNTKKEIPSQSAAEKDITIASQPGQAETTASEQITQPETPVAKAAYKPRFNAALNNKKEIPTQPVEEKETASSSQTEPAETPAPNQAAQPNTPAVKPIYKPRFSAAMAAKKDPLEESTDQKDINLPSQLEQTTAPGQETQPETPAEKPVYKPRFRPKAT